MSINNTVTTEVLLNEILLHVQRNLLLGKMMCVVDVLFTTNFSNKPFALFHRSFITFSPEYDVGFDKYFQRHFPLILYFICWTAGVTRHGFASQYW